MTVEPGSVPRSSFASARAGHHSLTPPHRSAGGPPTRAHATFAGEEDLVRTGQLASTVIAGALGAGLAVVLVGASPLLMLPAVLGVTAATVVVTRTG
jgi:hypothetical protein